MGIGTNKPKQLVCEEGATEKNDLSTDGVKGCIVYLY